MNAYNRLSMALVTLAVLLGGIAPAHADEGEGYQPAHGEPADAEAGFAAGTPGPTLYAARDEDGEIVRRMHSPGMVAGGAVVLSLGVTAGVATAIAAASVESGGWLDFSGIERMFWGISSAVSFAHGLGIGIPMIVVGAKKRPLAVQPVGAKQERDALVPTDVSVGPTSASIQWSF